MAKFIQIDEDSWFNMDHVMTVTRVYGLAPGKDGYILTFVSDEEHITGFPGQQNVEHELFQRRVFDDQPGYETITKWLNGYAAVAIGNN